jgi:predicted O-linked N-acetylglucosamine transferase (SPINDLY family)
MCTDVKAEQAQAKFNEGLALHQQGQLEQARQAYGQALGIEPNHVEALHLLGVIAAQSGQHTKAIDLINQSLSIHPNNALAWSNRANALRDSGQYQAAINSYDRAIALRPDYAKARSNRSLALQGLSQQNSGIETNPESTTDDHVTADKHFRRGIELSASMQFQAAVDSYDRAIALRPDFARAYFNRGNTLNALEQREAAIDSYERAIALDPHKDLWHCARLATMAYLCDWRGSGTQFLELIPNIERQGKAFLPFPILSRIASPSVQQQVAKAWTRWKHPPKAELGVFPQRTRKKIRLGYFSGDFKNHPVSFLTAGLFESHNRDRFEVYAFSFGINTQDEMRKRLEVSFDRFFDVKDLSDTEIATLARQLQIDIAIDLAGHTADARTGIFALRAAPVQVNYLGYPGTLGADYMDYLIADKTVIPEECRQHYTEKIAYLPDTYMASDSRRAISERTFTREELGLPEAGFVFCCFNNSYKITPETFGVWMRILNEVNGSVLWLSDGNATASANLRREAVLRGVDPQRLVFAQRMPLLADHLARHRAADLFLDTLPFNAHTTANDALWAGLPVLTCTGDAFASRVAASLLGAIEMPELITATPQDYEALAVGLAREPAKLKAIRQKLQHNWLTSPLFDTRLFTHRLEDAYLQMIERYHANFPPGHIYVEQ